MNQSANPRKLFVGNLPYSMTQDEITNLFAPYGNLSEVHLIHDRDSGQSRGIAFVEFHEVDDARRAQEALDRQPIDGRPLRVNVAKPKEDRQRNTGFRGGIRFSGRYSDRNSKRY